MSKIKKMKNLGINKTKKEPFNKYGDIIVVAEIIGEKVFKLIESINNFAGSSGTGMGRSFTNEIYKTIKSGIKNM